MLAPGAMAEILAAGIPGGFSVRAAGVPFMGGGPEQDTQERRKAETPTMFVYHVTGGKQPERQNYGTYLEELDGDFKKIRIVDDTPDGGSPIWPRSPDAGRHIEPHDVPTKVKVTGPNYPLLDFYDLYNCLVVPQAFKDLIEELEPGIHQFFPLELYRGKKKVADRYLFIFGQRLDTLHDTACDPPRYADGTLPLGGPTPIKIVFDKKKIGNAHAWVDKFAGGRNFSEALAQRIQALGLTGLNYNPAEAI